jgi:hypothetical protein
MEGLNIAQNRQEISLRKPHCLGITPQILHLQWDGEATLNELDLVVLAGGFSYGDYLRTGAFPCFSPIMEAIRTFGVPLRIVGLVVPEALRVLYNANDVVLMAVAELYDARHGALEGWFHR